MRGVVPNFILALAVMLGTIAGYYVGKDTADRYYAEHPVTLIQPLKYRVPATQAQIETPKETK